MFSVNYAYPFESSSLLSSLLYISPFTPIRPLLFKLPKSKAALPSLAVGTEGHTFDPTAVPFEHCSDLLAAHILLWPSTATKRARDIEKKSKKQLGRPASLASPGKISQRSFTGRVLSRNGIGTCMNFV